VKLPRDLPKKPMTPIELSTDAGIPASPFRAMGAAGATQALQPYRGVLTPSQLDAPEKETEALVTGAALHDLGWMRRVAVRGEDRFRWLNGMVTNSVNELAEDGGAWNLVLNAQGRIQGDLWVWREGDALELEIAADQQEKLLAHLNRYIIMDDVELVPLEDEIAIGVTGPHADAVMTRAGLPALEALKQTRAQWGGQLRVRRSYGVLAAHYEIWLARDQVAALCRALKDAGAAEVGADSLEAFRIAEAIPAYGVDMLERDLPQETSQLRALHFTKGCYLGQEIVERIRSRATVHRHLRQLELMGPLPASGTELFAAGESEGSKASGTITSAATLPLKSGARTFALGMVRAQAEAANSVLTYAGGTAKGDARILSVPPKFESE